MRLCVRWGPSSLQKGHRPEFSAHVYCRQTAGWMKVSFGTEVDLGPGHSVLDGNPTSPPRERGSAAPSFRSVYVVATVAPLSYC